MPKIVLGNRCWEKPFVENPFWKTVFGRSFLENTVFAIIFASTNLARKCNLKCNLKPSISFHLNLFSNGLRQAEARFTQIVFNISFHQHRFSQSFPNEKNPLSCSSARCSKLPCMLLYLQGCGSKDGRRKDVRCIG